MALTVSQHAATQDVLRQWLFDQTGRRVGGVIDWTNVGPREIQQLAYDMFDAAGVPKEAVQNYFSAFHQYIYNLP